MTEQPPILHAHTIGSQYFPDAPQVERELRELKTTVLALAIAVLFGFGLVMSLLIVLMSQLGAWQ